MYPTSKKFDQGSYQGTKHWRDATSWLDYPIYPSIWTVRSRSRSVKMGNLDPSRQCLQETTMWIMLTHVAKGGTHAPWFEKAQTFQMLLKCKIKFHSHRPIAKVLNPALEGCGLSGRHHDLDPRVVDEDRRVFAVDLVVVLRYGVTCPANATWSERRDAFRFS